METNGGRKLLRVGPILVRKQFEGGNNSRATTNEGNTVVGQKDTTASVCEIQHEILDNRYT